MHIAEEFCIFIINLYRYSLTIDNRLEDSNAFEADYRVIQHKTPETVEVKTNRQLS